MAYLTISILFYVCSKKPFTVGEGSLFLYVFSLNVDFCWVNN